MQNITDREYLRLRFERMTDDEIDEFLRSGWKGEQSDELARFAWKDFVRRYPVLEGPKALELYTKMAGALRDFCSDGEPPEKNARAVAGDVLAALVAGWRERQQP